jgi:signal transduction histidine kinase
MEQNNQPKIETGYGLARGSSSLETGTEAAKKALESIHIFSLSAVIVYASVEYDLEEVLKGVCGVAGDAPVFGTTTAGEICNGPYLGTVLVVALASPFLKVHCGVGSRVYENWEDSLNEAISAPDVRPFFRDVNECSRRIAREGRNVFIMLFSPGPTLHKYSHSFMILEKLKLESNGAYPIFGGSSAGKYIEDKRAVFCGKAIFYDSILLVVFETELQFGISLTHGFQPTNLRTTVTSVEGYEVLTLDGLPAEEACYRLFKVSSTDIRNFHAGIVVGISDPMGQYSISTAYVTPRGGIRLSRQVREGTVLTRMEPDSVSVVDAGTDALRKAIIRGGITDVAISFTHYCALRSLIIGEMYVEEISRMKNMVCEKPLIGFCTFGEQGVADDGISRYNNVSVACLVIGNELSQMAQVAFENNRLLKEAMEYDQLKSEFFSNISHEFRTPINVILGTLQLMEMQGLPSNPLSSDEKSMRRIKVMKQNCYRLLKMTNNLLDITKIEAGFFEITLHNYNIVQVIEDITLSVAEYTENKGLKLIFDTDIEEKVMAVDADKIERIMLNLLSNAVKFSKTGGRISVNIQNNVHTVCIIVSDTGIGIPENKLNIIFERFRQVDSSLSRDYEGSGIGLALVKNLVELHGGRISVKSDYGENTEFRIELPVKLIDEDINLMPISNKHNYVQRLTMEFSDIYAIR